jgi:shikimate kinase
VSKPLRLLLVGMMGSGKSTVGRIIAAQLGWAYLDSDDEVEKRTGSSVAEIWRAEGEEAFRAEESRVLAEALSGTGTAVVSVAGGTVLDPANRALIRSAGTVVWLRTQVGTLAERVGDGAGRPLLAGDPPAALERLLAQRRPFYEEVADIVVDTDGLDAVAVAEMVLAATGLSNTPVPGGGPQSAGGESAGGESAGGESAGGESAGGESARG